MSSYASLKRCALAGLSAALVLLSGLAPAEGQEATERFIPLGRSPGLSGTLTDLGTIESIDTQARSITLAGMPEGRRVSVTERTRIWLDRSGLEMTNTVGGFSDLEPGLRAEVKYEDPEAKAVADWIKVVPRSSE